MRGHVDGGHRILERGSFFFLGGGCLFFVFFFGGSFFGGKGLYYWPAVVTSLRRIQALLAHQKSLAAQLPMY